jgi:hypothetical protein
VAWLVVMTGLPKARSHAAIQGIGREIAATAVASGYACTVRAQLPTEILASLPVARAVLPDGRLMADRHDETTV